MPPYARRYKIDTLTVLVFGVFKKLFVDDIKSLLRILVMYLPMPMFWALYEQQYSVWLIQGIQMDCRLWGDVLLLPDQMQVFNPILVLVFIPIFEAVIYPTVGKCAKVTCVYPPCCYLL